jgi:tetratricopeptide (TPR) repeat protein
MLTDAQDLPISTDSPAAIAAIDQFAEQLLSYGKDAAVILEGLTADPSGVLTNAHAAALHLWLETSEAKSLAAPYLKVAQANLATATERERWYVEAIAAWWQGDLERALVYHQAIADKYPHDLVSLQIGQYHCLFSLGSSQGLLNLIETAASANKENPYVQGMLAFALEQSNRLEEAETVGRQATEMQRYNPWAHHAIAHVLATQGHIAEGIAWMESLADTWENCGSFLCHNWWHVGLYYLKQANFSKVLELYDRQVWGRADQGYSHCQVNAISLLLRLELHGVDVGDRWLDLSLHLGHRLHGQMLPLTLLHLVYGLVRSGQGAQADAILRQIPAQIRMLNSGRQATWTKVVLPAAHGMLAHAKADWSGAIANLEPSLCRITSVGGSHAQRQIFEQVYSDALVQAKQAPAAQLLL